MRYTLEEISSIIRPIAIKYNLPAVWLFGSYARGEASESSDLDLLVDYDKDSQVSLLDIIRYKNDLSRILGRDVDLIENGYLKPFAFSSAEHDKYLVYER